MLTLLLFVIFIACVGCLYTEGMWGNAIRLINVVTAALLATNFWEPTAAWLEGYSETFATYTYLWDFLALWGLFGIFMVIFRAATDLLSRVKVRFLKLADRIGSVVFAAWIGWVMVCFTAMTLHTAPLARDFMGGAFKPEQRAANSWSPEIKWLGFVQKMSRGQFCRSATEQQWKDEKYVFDPHGLFMPKYATRRANLEAYMNQHSTLRVLPEDLQK